MPPENGSAPVHTSYSMARQSALCQPKGTSSARVRSIPRSYCTLTTNGLCSLSQRSRLASDGDGVASCGRTATPSIITGIQTSGPRLGAVPIHGPARDPFRNGWPLLHISVEIGIEFPELPLSTRRSKRPFTPTSLVVSLQTRCRRSPARSKVGAKSRAERKSYHSNSRDAPDGCATDSGDTTCSRRKKH